MMTNTEIEIYRRYFQKSSEYYIAQIEKFEKERSYSFNVAAFFLGVFWMAYRKMYKIIFIFIGITMAQTFIQNFLFNTGLISYDTYEIIDTTSILIYGSILGFIANRVYVTQAKKEIAEILDTSTNEEEIDLRLSKKGGVSLSAPLVLLIIFAAVILISLFFEN